MARAKKIKIKFSTEVVSKIVESMRPSVEEIISSQRAEVERNIQTLIEDETRKYNDNIQVIQKQQEEDKAEREKKAAALTAEIEALLALQASI